MILEKYDYSKTALLGKVVLLTGGGGGIGLNAARAFAYMGAKVIIAEIDAEKEQQTPSGCDFFHVDISKDSEINRLHAYILNKYARLDVLIHNAAVVPMGAACEVPITDWDRSYAVNLRAPVLLNQKFLPLLKENGGVIVFNPSAPGAYMSAYEVFKTAQVELMNALDVELEGSGVITYGVAPGFVKTDTCRKAVDIVASSLNMRAEEFFAAGSDILTDAETAGTGYAVSVANAKKYSGQVVFSTQVLKDAGLIDTILTDNTVRVDIDKILPLMEKIKAIFNEQHSSWKKKNIFQKQFILGDFKKFMGIPADVFKQNLDNINTENIANSKDMLIKLRGFYGHQKELLIGFEKNPALLKRDTDLLDEWMGILREIVGELH